MYILKDKTIKDIADAIRTKKGSTDLIKPKDMGDEIESLNTVSSPCIIDTNGDIYNDGILGPDGTYYECGAIANSIYDNDADIKRKDERTVVTNKSVILTAGGDAFENTNEFSTFARLYPSDNLDAILWGVDNYVFANNAKGKQAVLGICEATGGGSPDNVVQFLIESYGQDYIQNLVVGDTSKEGIYINGIHQGDEYSGIYVNNGSATNTYYQQGIIDANRDYHSSGCLDNTGYMIDDAFIINGAVNRIDDTSQSYALISSWQGKYIADFKLNKSNNYADGIYSIITAIRESNEDLTETVQFEKILQRLCNAYYATDISENFDKSLLTSRINQDVSQGAPKEEVKQKLISIIQEI